MHWIQRVTLPTFLPQDHWLMVTWTWAMETRVSWCQIFHKIIICIKSFFFLKKENYSSCEFWNFPHGPQGKLSSLRPASGAWTRILLIQKYIYIYIYKYIQNVHRCQYIYIYNIYIYINTYMYILYIDILNIYIYVYIYIFWNIIIKRYRTVYYTREWW